MSALFTGCLVIRPWAWEIGSMGFSIITAVHNGLPMNELFWECLTQNTLTPFELIVVDNHSTDGSEIFFHRLARQFAMGSQRIIYLRNSTNKGYPVSQNQGMAAATYPYLCFLNNDVWLPKGWEIPLLKAVQDNPYLVVSPSGQEAQPTQKASDALKLRWRRILFFSQLWAKARFKTERERLEKALVWMYGSLQNFESPTAPCHSAYFNGIKGDAIVMTRAFVEKMGFVWDETIEAADWHLYLSIAKRAEADREIPLPRVILDSYVHHFGRYSARLKYEPIRPVPHYRRIESVWTAEEIARLWWGNALPVQ